VRSVEVVAEKKTVLEHEFACKKITFKAVKGERLARGTLWLSPEVKGSGMVGLRLEMDLENKETAVVAWDLAGHGSADKTLLGETLEDLKKKVEKK
jgi:hypothetical protein